MFFSIYVVLVEEWQSPFNLFTRWLETRHLEPTATAASRALRSAICLWISTRWVRRWRLSCCQRSTQLWSSKSLWSWPSPLGLGCRRRQRAKRERKLSKIKSPTNWHKGKKRHVFFLQQNLNACVELFCAWQSWVTTTSSFRPASSMGQLWTREESVLCFMPMCFKKKCTKKQTWIYNTTVISYNVGG